MQCMTLAPIKIVPANFGVQYLCEKGKPKPRHEKLAGIALFHCLLEPVLNKVMDIIIFVFAWKGEKVLGMPNVVLG